MEEYIRGSLLVKVLVSYHLGIVTQQNTSLKV